MLGLQDCLPLVLEQPADAGTQIVLGLHRV